MKLSPELQSAVETAGARVRFRYPWWLRPFLLPGVIGITLGRRIYLRADPLHHDIEALIRHELAHVRQVAALGLIPFYVRYVTEYVRNRRNGMSAGEAYRNISFEKEALAAERGTAVDI